MTKVCFWPIFPILGQKKTFWKIQLIISYRILAPCQNLEKTNNTIPRKCPDRQDGQTDSISKDTSGHC